MIRLFPSRPRPVLAALLAFACRPDAERPERVPAPEPPPAARAVGEPLFDERAAASGLDFRHENGRTGKFRYCEMMGSGVALLDADRDGDLDVYMVQGGPLEDSSAARPHDRLFRNELDRAAGTLRFVDATEESGLRAEGYGMGALAADFDGDGWTDLYLSNLGPDQLWRARGDGTFEDATAAAGLANPQWSVSAAAFDYDRDGDLDLYVGNYLEYSVAGDKECTDELGARNYCGPLSFPPLPDRLWRNRGDGTFEDVSHPAGITAAFGGALGVVAEDFDRDGWPDVYVANDGTPNQLWMNRGDGTFEDRALYAGCAVNGEGRAEAGMGIAVADVDADLDQDVVVGHLDRETNTLYVNDGRAIFSDRSAVSGLGAPSLDRTTFGIGFLDADLDGDPDLVTVNGAVKVLKDLALAGDPWPLHQRDQLYLHEGGAGRWNEVEGAGIGGISEVGRGAAFGDLDDDGDTDVVVSGNGGPVRLYLGRAAERGAWIGLALVDGLGRPAVGARARLLDPDSAEQSVRLGGSYASTGDPRLLFGLGAEARSREVRVRWPDGRQEDFGPLPPGAYATLRPGDGRPVRGEAADSGAAAGPGSAP